MAKAFDRDVDKPVVDAISAIADARGVPMAQVALAWVLSKPAVSCPIVGATKAKHLQDAVTAVSVDLTHAEATALEQPYTPQDKLTGADRPSAESGPARYSPAQPLSVRPYTATGAKEHPLSCSRSAWIRGLGH